MTEPVASIAPTEINMHKKSRLLEIAFSDGLRFNYPCEYLRVFADESRVQPLDKINNKINKTPIIKNKQDTHHKKGKKHSHKFISNSNEHINMKMSVFSQ